MNFLLLSSYTDEYRPLHDITFPTKAAYARQWGHEAAALRHADPPRLSWERVKMWREQIERCDYLFFTGADAMVTNPAINIATLTLTDHDFFFAIDNNGLNADSWVMRNCQANRDFLDRVQKEERNFPNEQDAMQVVLARMKDYGQLRTVCDEVGGGEEFFSAVFNGGPVRAKILPASLINARPADHYNGDGSEPWAWTPESLILHMPGKDLDFRIKNMPLYFR